MQSLRDSPPRQSQSKEIKRLKAELAEVTQERDYLLGDCDRYLKRIKELEGRLSPEVRDRVLASLGVGKQSPQYKRVKAVLDQFIGEAQGGKNKSI
jgi:3-deoxy-D-arabino-heptulosonate 7-phosphate (DAHP) synthase class II